MTVLEPWTVDERLVAR